LTFGKIGHEARVAGATGWRVGAAGAAILAVVAGFLIGRTTAAGAKPEPGLTAVGSASAAIALPPLSQAAPLPALRAKAAKATVRQATAPAVVTSPSIVTVSVPVVTAPPPSKATRHAKPVRIGGDG
jgi:hypothetical protein